jgi:protein farnesyltransferase/geranylgeranyltransferase type-1 subunit alpha
MNYFRAMLLANEHSQRSFDLTSHALKLNPANYTAWYFRRKVMLTLFTGEEARAALLADREFVGKLGLANPKNYQIWFHRRWLVEQLRPGADDPVQLARDEFEYSAEVLAEDNKNYHTWAHRQWVVEAFDLWDDELAYAAEMVDVDVMNNSAWNQRMYALTRKNSALPLAADVRSEQTAWALERARKRPNNECPWVFIKGLYRCAIGGQGAFFEFTGDLKQQATEMMERYITSPHPMSLLVDILEGEETDASLKEAGRLCGDLAEHQDTIHKRFWEFRGAQVLGKVKT